MAIFFCIVIFIFLVWKVLIRFSYLKLDIKEFELLNNKAVKFEVEISLNLFNKIKWIKLTLNKEKAQKLKDSKRKEILDRLLNTRILKDYKNANEVILKNWKVILQEFKKIEIDKFKLETRIGTEEADKTAYANTAVLAIIPIFLARKAKVFSYKVEPVYINKNYLFLSINCIFTFKLVHIININKQIKRREVYQKYGGTSNRKSYARSNG